MTRDVTRASPEGIRAFVALDLDSTSLRRVVRLSDLLRMSSGAPSAAWVAAAKMHVTLKFIAALPERAIDPLREAVKELAQGNAAPGACPLRLEAFPSTAKARTVVAELVDASGSLAAMAASIDARLVPYGVPAETRALRPHVTLARLKLEYDARRWLRAEFADVAGDCRAASLTLYKSTLGAAGSTYEALERVTFAAAPSAAP